VNVEILETDQRRVALLAIAVVAAVTCLLIGIALLIRPKTPFEQQQALADASCARWSADVVLRDALVSNRNSAGDIE
jgi:hypothetical protein